MRVVRRWTSLTVDDRVLILRAWFWLVVVRCSLWFVPFRQVRRIVAASAPGRWARFSGNRLPSSIGWAVEAVGRRTPGATCLVRALAAQVLLQRAGHSADLRIGIARDGTERIAAHAWVESQGSVIVGDDERALFNPLPGFDVASR